MYMIVQREADEVVVEVGGEEGDSVAVGPETWGTSSQAASRSCLPLDFAGIISASWCNNTCAASGFVIMNEAHNVWLSMLKCEAMFKLTLEWMEDAKQELGPGGAEHSPSLAANLCQWLAVQWGHLLIPADSGYLRYLAAAFRTLRRGTTHCITDFSIQWKRQGLK
jgi:hypothetical protein